MCHHVAWAEARIKYYTEDMVKNDSEHCVPVDFDYETHQHTIDLSRVSPED